MKGIKIAIHPLYFFLLVFYIVIGKGAIFIAFFAVTVAHELAHAYMARRLGYGMNRITLMPYGAVLTRLESLPDKVAVKIALAGPCFNFVLALATVGMWWLMPSIYIYTEAFCYANIAIGAVNLAPCYPLDGSRVIIGLAKHKMRAIKLTRLFSILFGLVMVGLGVASIWYTFNATLPIMGAYLILNAFIGGDKEHYEHITASMPWVKDYKRGVKVSTVRMTPEATLLDVLRLIDKRNGIIIELMCGDGQIITLSEDEIRLKFEQGNLTDTLGKIYIKSDKL